MSVAISEMAEFVANELHLVKQGANGFPELLAKSAAEEVDRAALDTMARNPDETANDLDEAASYKRRPHTPSRSRDMAKKNKKLKKAIKRAIKRSTIDTVAEKQTGTQTGWSTLGKAIGGLAKSKGESQRRKALVKSIDAAVAVGDMQSARALSYQLAKENIVRVRKEAFEGLARAGLSDQDQPRAIQRASARAIGNAQRPQGRAVGNSQRATLRDAYFGDYVPEMPDADETMLESQRRIIEAEEGLRKATTPAEREKWGYILTREQLRDGHSRGVI